MVERWRRPGHEPGRFFELVRDGFLLSLRPFIRIPMLALAGAALSIAGAYALYGLIGTDYLPALDEGGFTLDYTAPPASTLESSPTSSRRRIDIRTASRCSSPCRARCG